jgi:hypothetical protein
MDLTSVKEVAADPQPGEGTTAPEDLVLDLLVRCLCADIRLRLGGFAGAEAGVVTR